MFENRGLPSHDDFRNSDRVATPHLRRSAEKHSKTSPEICPPGLASNLFAGLLRSSPSNDAERKTPDIKNSQRANGHFANPRKGNTRPRNPRIGVEIFMVASGEIVHWLSPAAPAHLRSFAL